jgi:FAD/FMN-containing dehydrogenase
VSAFLTRTDIVSWGRVIRAPHGVAHPQFLDQLPSLLAEGATHANGVLASGLRRSYGDTALNAEGALIETRSFDRLISFDAASGLLEAEAGISIAKILAFAIPRGFFLPVTPGTKFVTLGGAVANDVHGKNHHRAGTFGRWVRRLTLLRSDGSQHVLTPNDASGLFAATIGGLGLTGVITRVALQLKPIVSSDMIVEAIPFADLAGFFALSRESAETHEYSVAWIDCLAGGRNLGRGLMSRANHASAGELKAASKSGPTVPVDMPEFMLNRLSISAFNSLYYWKGSRSPGTRSISYDPYFYPLDGLQHWNRLYGRRGMYQYQSVVAPAVAHDATTAMLKTISSAGTGSFLAVLKDFGDAPSPGFLSFPRAGTTLALDFPNRGAETLHLLARLDSIVREAGGRLYPAKDGRLPADLFRSGYPEMERFVTHLDPGLSSSFWRRMQG